MNWWILPNNTSLLFVGRNGSTALARQILATHYPEREAARRAAHIPTHLTEARTQTAVPSAAQPQGAALVAVREPVERFRSACARTSKTVEQGLAALHTDLHFMPVSFALQGVRPHRVFRLFDELPALCDALAIPVPAQENESAPGTKPDLTPEELASVQAHYAADIALYAGTALESAVPPAPALRFGTWLDFVDHLNAKVPGLESRLVFAARQNDALFLWLTRATGQGEVYLDHPQTIAGFAALVAAGVITQAERDAVFTA